MSKPIAELLKDLKQDPWRIKTGFNQDIEEAHKIFWDTQSSPSVLQETLNSWIQRNQPCLFGRIAATRGFLSYCILTESDLNSSDDHISEKIQLAREAWWGEGWEGKKSGFVILAISKALALAEPNNTVKQIAIRLSSLYLQSAVTTDQVFLENVFLEKPGYSRTMWRWDAGVNYFSAQGDKRWWQDHRIPGGVAFSVNSVGHMVKSQIMSSHMKEMDRALRTNDEDWATSKVDSLEKALELAMRTISRASIGPSGKATQLLALPDEENDEGHATKCPYNIHSEFKNNDYCSYLGHYHTDYTVPSEYFCADVERPDGSPQHTLDFTYLFHKHIDNPAHITMGEGQQIRSDEADAIKLQQATIAGHLGKVQEEEVDVSAYPRLANMLSNRRVSS